MADSQPPVREIPSGGRSLRTAWMALPGGSQLGPRVNLRGVILRMSVISHITVRVMRLGIFRNARSVGC